MSSTTNICTIAKFYRKLKEENHYHKIFSAFSDILKNPKAGQEILWA